MKVVTPSQMGRIDRFCIDELGIPGVVLMENAALRVVEETAKCLGTLQGKNVLVFAGKGNNGGDAFAAARHLVNRGTGVRVYALANKNMIAGDAAINLSILEKTGIEVNELTEYDEIDKLRHEFYKADAILDGIFGTGLKGNIEGVASEVIRLINQSGKLVVSIDIPSGINGESGKILGCCVKAHKTVTFGLPKVGLLVHPGCEYTGELVVADISIPGKALEHFNINVNLIDYSLVSNNIPTRFANSSKGDYGKIIIVSGSKGMTGAGCLCASAALRSGAGLVYLAVPSSLMPIYETVVKEAVTVPVEDEGQGYFTGKYADRILKNFENKDIAVLGPGLSLNEGVGDVVFEIIKNANIPLIIDADALTLISRNTSILKNLKAGAVLTPHPGEMARLTGIKVEDIQSNRLEVAKEFAVKWGVITVLKGARTIVALPDGTVYINPTGNAGMATGGTGDVLAGIIAALAGQKAKLSDAAVMGVYLHGLAGDRVAASKGEHGLIAGDLVEELPYAMKDLLAKNH